VAVYGGNDGGRYDQEQRSLRMGADVVIATPGRLLSHIKVGNVDLSRVSFFVLDEADRMLDMGFSDDILQINKLLPQSCQKIMFSATMPSKIRELAVSLLHNPVEVKIAVSRPADKIQQSAYVCYDPQKLKIIQQMFKGGDLQRVIIFCGKKDRVKEIARELKSMKINCAPMHSDLTQAERDEVMYKFKAGHIDVLVATDIVSRGIDIDDIRIVINYDVPHDSEDYVHRIGRTARADRDGMAITFVNDRDIIRFKKIEQFLKKEVTKNPLPDGIGEGPDYNATAMADGKGRSHRRGRRGNGHGGRGGHGNGRKDRGRGRKGTAESKN
jgi:superfamily II DNA/RNA helicase